MGIDTSPKIRFDSNGQKEVSVLWDPRMEENKKENIDRYQDLYTELKRILEMPTDVVLIMTRALRTILKRFKRNNNNSNNNCNYNNKERRDSSYGRQSASLNDI